MNEPTIGYGVDRSARGVAYLRGVIGAVLGGAFGFGLCWWLTVKMGIYAVAMPGAFLGLGCGTLSRIRSIPLGLLCLVAGFALGIVMEWFLFPFRDDPSLGYFLQNLNRLDNPSRTRLFVGLGMLFAGWFGLGNERMSITVKKTA